jgi:hypothetical protein
MKKNNTLRLLHADWETGLFTSVTSFLDDIL